MATHQIEITGPMDLNFLHLLSNTSINAIFKSMTDASRCLSYKVINDVDISIMKFVNGFSDLT